MARERVNFSDAALAVMRRGFAKGQTAEFIAQAVLDETKERVAVRTVARRAAEWRLDTAERKAQRERMVDLVDAMAANHLDGPGMIKALAADHLIQHPEELTGADPIELHGLALKAEVVRLKKREIDVRERVVAIDEKKLDLLEGREKRAVAALARGTEEMSAEDRINEIRRIYGLGQQATG